MNDAPPSTRNNLIAAALECILEVGVQQSTAREIARRAGVSLGTLTYHFPSRDELVALAFESLVERVATVFRARLEAATSVRDAEDAVVDLICGGLWASSRHLLLSFELYAQALRIPMFRVVIDEWMAKSRQALQLHFDEETAVALDALIEGFTVHQVLSSSPASQDLIRSCVQAVSRRGGRRR